MKTSEVKIFGHTFSLRADIDDVEIQRVAEHVDTRMKEVAASSPSASVLQVAILAALDIASESPDPQIDPEMAGLVEQKADAMLQLLDSVAPELSATT